MIKFFT